MFYYAPHPLIDRAPGNDITFLTTYTTHTHASGHNNIYIYVYIYIYILHIVGTCGKAIIGMTLRAIKTLPSKDCGLVVMTYYVMANKFLWLE